MSSDRLPGIAIGTGLQSKVKPQWLHDSHWQCLPR